MHVSMYVELAEALQLLHSMADLFFDSVCKLSDNASLLDERNPLYHSGVYVLYVYVQFVCIMYICMNVLW